MADSFWKLRIPVRIPELFDHQKRCKIKSPHDKIPGGSVPETGEEPDHQKIAEPFGEGDTVSSEGDINVITKPGAEGDMPSAPEFGNTCRKIGIIEILREFKTKDPAETDSHIAVAGEIEIDLQGEGNGIDPDKKYRSVTGFSEEAAQLSKGVCQKYLLSQTENETADAGGEFFQCMAAAF